MPDGDRVHKGLTWKYQNPYKKVCDGQYGGEQLAYDVVSAVWKDIQQGGDKLLLLCQHVSEQCQHILSRSKAELIDWQHEHAQVDEIAQPIYTDRRLKALAIEACKEQLQDLRYGANPSNCYVEILRKYSWNVYIAQFEERVPLTPKHYQNVSREFVRGRLELMRPDVQERLLQYIKQTFREGTVHLARTPRQRIKQKYTIDTDVFTVGA